MARVLIIDDEAVIRRMIRGLLEWEGHEVLEAPEGEAGLSIQRKYNTDLIITDLNMPKLDGFELIKHLRSESPKLAIIAISGGGSLEEKNYFDIALELGADKALKKPFTRKEMLIAVEELLSR